MAHATDVNEVCDWSQRTINCFRRPRLRPKLADTIQLSMVSTSFGLSLKRCGRKQSAFARIRRHNLQRCAHANGYLPQERLHYWHKLLCLIPEVVHGQKRGIPDCRYCNSDQPVELRRETKWIQSLPQWYWHTLRLSSRYFVGFKAKNAAPVRSTLLISANHCDSIA